MTDLDARALVDAEREARLKAARVLEDKLRDRIHDVGNHVNRVEGMVTEVRVSANERYTRLDDQQREVRAEVAGIGAKVDGLRDSVDNKLESQRVAMEAKLESIRSGLSKDFSDVTKELGNVKVNVGRIDVKTVGVVGAIVVIVNILGPVLLGL